jgi:hypothetical protein
VVLDLQPKAGLRLKQSAELLVVEQSSGLPFVSAVDPEVGVKVRVTTSEIMSTDRLANFAPRRLSLDRKAKTILADEWYLEARGDNRYAGSRARRLRGAERYGSILDSLADRRASEKPTRIILGAGLLAEALPDLTLAWPEQLFDRCHGNSPAAVRYGYDSGTSISSRFLAQNPHHVSGVAPESI